MIKPEKFSQLHLVYHFTVPLKNDSILPTLLEHESEATTIHKIFETNSSFHVK